MMTVGIVGAGISGLAAARALLREGHDVRVFERAPHPGGRLATRFIHSVELPRMGTRDLAFDHGAQYFTVRDPHFATVVNDWMSERRVAKWSARIVAFDHEGWEAVDENTIRYVAVPSMSALAVHLAHDVNPTYNARVTAIERVSASPIRWRVLANLEDLGEFDRIILAVPPQNARTLLPAGSPLADQLASVDSKPCWAVLVAFEEPVTSPFDAAFVSGSPLGWIARNSSKPKRDHQSDTWVLHATKEWSEAHADDRSDTVGPFLLNAFADLIRAGLPPPFFLNAFRWREATVDPPLATTALYDPKLGLAICGDWCLGSRVEDAFLSGLEAVVSLSTSFS